MPTLNIREILEALPHRPPFLLIDKVLDLVPGESIDAIKNVTINEPFFQGHFPGRPVMPGVLVLEALAQASGVLAYATTKPTPSDDFLYYFVGVENARFKRIIEPGDTIHMHVEVLRSIKNFWKVKGTAIVDNEPACEAELLSIGREG